MNIYRGDIYYIENSKYFSVEYQSGTGSRPAIIVSNDACNHNSDECTVVYLTRTDDAPHIPTHVPVICKVPSIAKCETVCRINQNRIGEFIRALTKAEMEAIDKALMIQLGIEMPAAPEADAKAMEALQAELAKRNEAYEVLDLKRKELEAEYRKLAMEFENVQAKWQMDLDKKNKAMLQREGFEAELNAEKAVNDRYAQEIASLQAQRAELEKKLEECRTAENAKIKELDALLEAEKSTSLLYKAQLDAQDIANEELRKMLTEAEKINVTIYEQEAEEPEKSEAAAEYEDKARRIEEAIQTGMRASVAFEVARDENIRLKAEINVYKGMIGKLIPQLA